MKKVAFFSYDLRVGGAEKMVFTLLPEFINAGYLVDLVLIKRSGDLLSDVDSRVNIISLEKDHGSQAVFSLIRYFRKASPDIFISNLTHLNNLSLIARLLSRSKAVLVVIEHSTISINNLGKGGKEGISVRLSRILYPLADKVVVVSKGAARDLIVTLKIDPAKVDVIYNPIDIKAIHKLMDEAVDGDWFTPKTTPVLLAVGRLVKEKNYPFMLEVFKQVRKKRDIRLVILGEGEERPFLENRIRELGLQNSVRMPGIKKNPYSYMAKADIMLCTSVYEGFNIALAESLACGTPVISIDCPYGPAEILEDGKYGILIPMGDSAGMAKAIIEGIDKPEILPSKETLRRRASDFSAGKIFLDYQELISKALSDKQQI